MASLEWPHIDAKYWLLENFENLVKRIILHRYSSNHEINLLSLAILDRGASIYRVPSALKVNLLHTYACFLHKFTDV